MYQPSDIVLLPFALSWSGFTTHTHQAKPYCYQIHVFIKNP